MYIWGHKLERAAPRVLDGQFEDLAGLVVQDLQVYSVASLFETRHDAVVCRNAMAVLSRLEWFNQDGVGVNVVSQHYAVIATARADGEATHVVRVQIAYWVREDVNLLGLCGWKLAGDVGERVLRGWFGFGGARALSGMGHVTLQGLNIELERGNKLERAAPCVLDGKFVGLAGLVFQDL